MSFFALLFKCHHHNVYVTLSVKTQLKSNNLIMR